MTDRQHDPYQPCMVLWLQQYRRRARGLRAITSCRRGSLDGRQ